MKDQKQIKGELEMAFDGTITRENLVQAMEELSHEFVSKKAHHKLLGWSHDASDFYLAQWEDCPLDQIGLVKTFKTRRNYDPVEDKRFAFEAQEVDARILNYVQSDLQGEHRGIRVQVI